MKAWRERIVEARERGAFTDEDKELARRCATCAVGEAARSIGKTHDWYVAFGVEEAIHSGGFTNRVVADAFDAAETFLDAIEDRVLELKRTAAR